ncbi:hypothetical protein J8273_2285 [Carpediemonas membranifera]|uniref:Uncharacterized protein n=1 Tax=Carpediemonas membranifera TaxID=201153 RepID=A0A8J6E3S2_9EUKA|nr:hypothetical protein J8273_2285 [Carpediemonas membranifera]|eukprot:KAG9395936.1 hypothetical protein J8273_2285 [Carpediemonas membranifera]
MQSPLMSPMLGYTKGSMKNHRSISDFLIMCGCLCCGVASCSCFLIFSIITAAPVISVATVTLIGIIITFISRLF